MFDPADESPFRLDVAGVSAPFEVLAFTGHEAISEPFVFEIDLLIDDPQLDLAGLLFHSARLYFGPAGNSVHGQLQSLVQHEQGKATRLCRARLGPRLNCLDLRFSRRVFSGRTVPQIIEHVLREHGITGTQFRFELQAGYPSLTFCTQYGETDLQLVQRLCGQSRIHYHFEHGSGGHCLVFGDAPARLPQAEETEFVDEVSGGTPASQGWQLRETAAGKDWSATSCTAEGHSSLPALRSGRWLRVLGHPFAQRSADWLLTRIEHRADQALEPAYSNRFVAVDPSQARLSAIVRSTPRMSALQRAWVVAVDEPRPDRSRPVAVQFDWLYQGEGAKPSHCWLPLAPALAGMSMTTLREGVEVVVSFLEGDPDRPVISGVLQPAVNDDPEGIAPPALPGELASDGMVQWLKSAEPLMLLCLMPGGGSYRHCPEPVCSCRLVAGLHPDDGR